MITSARIYLVNEIGDNVHTSSPYPSISPSSLPSAMISSLRSYRFSFIPSSLLCPERISNYSFLCCPGCLDSRKYLCVLYSTIYPDPLYYGYLYYPYSPCCPCCLCCPCCPCCPCWFYYPCCLDSLYYLYYPYYPYYLLCGLCYPCSRFICCLSIVVPFVLSYPLCSYLSARRTVVLFELSWSFLTFASFTISFPLFDWEFLSFYPLIFRLSSLSRFAAAFPRVGYSIY